jgi:hypothetical protein
MRIKAMTEGSNPPESAGGEAALAVGPGTGAEPGAQDLLRDGEAEGLFEMANLFPRTTGLPMTVWVSPRGNARHDVRVKVNVTHGNQVNIANTAVVAVRPTPRVVAGQLSPDDRQAVFQWVQLNAAALVAYWEGQIDTIQLGEVLKPAPTRQP